jgi:hypothetical protein
LLHRLSGAVLYLFVCLTLALAVVSIGLSAIHSLNWDEFEQPLVALLLMLGFLYWTTTLLPGPVKRLGKAAGRQVVKSMRSKGKR